MGKPAGFALVAALVVGGCANVEIDVDVYKGPLANHEDMQVQQLAAMAVAARPLLVGLRDELAMADIHRRLNTALGDPRRDVWRNDGAEKYYERICQTASLNSHLRRMDRGDCKEFVAPRAERVNAIIGLYEPKGGRFDGVFGELASLHNRYSELIRRDADVALGFASRKEAIEKSAAPAASAKTVSKAAIRFLEAQTVGGENPTPQGSPTQQTIDAPMRGLANALGIRPEAAAKAQSSNEAALWLVDQRNWRRKIDAAFGTDAAGRISQEVADGIVARARAYLEARELLVSGLDLALDLYADPTSLLRAQPNSRDLIANPGARAAIEERNRLRRQLAPFIGTLVQGEHLVIALSLPPEAGASASTIIDGLKSRMTVTIADFDDRQRTGQQRAEAAKAAGEDLARWLVTGLRNDANGDNDARDQAAAIRALDSRLRSAAVRATQAPSLPGDTWLINRLKERDRFRFGFGRGPTVGPAMEEAERAWQTAIGSAGIGLEDGRSDDGLVQYIEAFLRKRDGAEGRARNKGLPSEAWPLLDAIGDFATKVAFLADNDSVFAGGATQSATVTRYIAALQAVANQLTVQVDEIRRRQTHRDRHPGAAARQAAAHVLAVSPERAVAGLLSNLEGLSPAQSLELRTIEAALTELKLSSALTVDAATKAKIAADEPVKPSESKRDQLRALDARLALASAAVARGQVFDRALADAAADSALDANLTYTAFADAVAARAKRPALPGLPLTPEAAAAADAIERFLGDLRTDDAFKSGDKPRADWEAAIRKRLPEAVTAVAAVLAAATKEAADFKAKADAATAAETLAKRAADLRAELKAKNAAYAVVNPERPALVQIYESAQKQTPPADAWAALKAELRRRAGLGAADARAHWARASATADTMNPPSARDVDSALAALPPGATALETLDALIQNLRFERVEATRRLGADSPQVKSIQDAIDAAHEQRSGMTYIRPPAAFLRMVNAASAIQPNPGLGAENRLQRSFWRSVPLIGPALGNLGEEENLRVRADIDRQNWQTINRVRLDGAGRTNYALVKDDIGNWYAKGYEADTTKIVDSMRGLAMFNIGARLPGLSPAAGASVADQSQMGRALNQFREAHANEMAALYETVRILSDSIVAQAKAAVDSGVKLDNGRSATLKAQLEGFWSAVKPLAETPSIPKDQDRAAVLRKAISDRLSDLLVFRTRAIAATRSAATAATSTSKQEDAAAYSKPDDAAKAMSDALSDSVAEPLSRLLAAIEKFEKEALVLSAASKD